MAKKYQHKGIDFDTSAEFWEKNYQLGSTSGTGSYGRMADFKAKVVNDFVREHGIERVLDFGCGDGNQNSLFDIPHYVGLDVSATIIEKNRQKYEGNPAREFHQIRPDLGGIDLTAFAPDLTISLDVIFHLIEDEVYNAYMRGLFGSGNRYVIAFTHKLPEHEVERRAPAAHVVLRNIEHWVRENAPDFEMLECYPNPYLNEAGAGGGSPCSVFIFEKQGA